MFIFFTLPLSLTHTDKHTHVELTTLCPLSFYCLPVLCTFYSKFFIVARFSLHVIMGSHAGSFKKAYEPENKVLTFAEPRFHDKQDLGIQKEISIGQAELVFERGSAQAAI